MIDCQPCRGFVSWFLAAMSLSAVALSLTLSIPGCASQPTGGPAASLTPPREEPLTGDFRVIEDRPDRAIVELPNRMILIAQEAPIGPVVSAQVWVKTGSIYEQEHVGAGLSHFLEHLLSGGSTSTRTEAESNAILGRIGAQVNAATGLDTARYYVNTTSDHTSEAIDLLSDWMQNSLITQAEYAREREVIQREFEQGKGDAGRVFWRITQQARYLYHPARHPTIGYLDEFLTITRDEIYDFYRRMYVPNNMVFVVTGDIDRRAVIDQVAALWRDQQAKPLPDLSFPEETEITDPRAASAVADIPRPRVRLLWPGTRIGEEHDYALDLLAVVIGQGESSRLTQTIRQQQRLVTNISAFNWSTDWGKGFFSVDFEVADFRPGAEVEAESPRALQEARVAAATAAVRAQIAAVRDRPVSEAELERAKRKVMSRIVQANQTADDLAVSLATYTIGQADPDYLQHYARLVEAVTPTQLQIAAARFLQPQRQITVTLWPQADWGDPAEPAREALTLPAGIKREPVEIDNTALLTRLNQTMDARSSQVRPLVVGEPQLYRLPNGLRLIVQRSTIVPAVSMQLYSLGGLLADEPGREGVANAAATMLIKGAVVDGEPMDATQLAGRLEDLGATLSTASGNNTSYAQASSLAGDWPTVLKLLRDVWLQPTFPQDEWQTLQPRLAAAIDAQSSRWYGELQLVFRGRYFGDHPWSQTPLGRREVVESVTAGDLARFHKQRLAASQTVLAVVGDVEPDEVRRMVGKLFGEMPARAAVPFDPPKPTQAKPGRVQQNTQKPMAAVNIGFGPGMLRSSDDYAAMQVLARVLSDFPSGWLEQELRGARGDGLAYAVWAGNVTGLVPGYFTVVFNTAQEKVDEAIKRTNGLIERARNGEFTEADIQRARAKVLSTEFLAKQSNSDRAAELALDELYGVSDPGAKQFLSRVQQIDAATLQSVAQKYLRRPVTVVLTNNPPEVE